MENTGPLALDIPENGHDQAHNASANVVAMELVLGSGTLASVSC